MESGAGAPEAPVMVVSTYPSRLAATRAARDAVGAGLAACANMANVASVYRWDGRIVEEPEYLVLFKTTAGVCEALKGRIAKMHPYDVPEIAEIAPAAVNKPYLEWLVESTLGRGQAESDAPKLNNV